MRRPMKNEQKRYRVREGFIELDGVLLDNIDRWYGSSDPDDIARIQEKGLTRGDIYYTWEFDAEGRTDAEFEEILGLCFEEI